MNVFYGAAIQGARNRGERTAINAGLITTIKTAGLRVNSEHTTGSTKEETAKLLEATIGQLPTEELERRRYVRHKMIEMIEGDIVAAVFEVSVPSLGTGDEIAHAYLRPRLGLSEIPILALYQKDFWPHQLSTMIRGITSREAPQFEVYDYLDLADAQEYLLGFLSKVRAN